MEHHGQNLRKRRQFRRHVRVDSSQGVTQSYKTSLLERITESTTGLISLGVLSFCVIGVACYLIHLAHQPKHIYVRSFEDKPHAATPYVAQPEVQAVQSVRSVETTNAEERADAATPLANNHVVSSKVRSESTDDSGGSSSGKIHVRGYTRKDGTYVAPYDRSRPHRHK